MLIPIWLKTGSTTFEDFGLNWISVVEWLGIFRDYCSRLINLKIFNFKICLLSLWSFYHASFLIQVYLPASCVRGNSQDALKRRDSCELFVNLSEIIWGICLPNLNIWVWQAATNITSGEWVINFFKMIRNCLSLIEHPWVMARLRLLGIFQNMNHCNFLNI